MNEIIKRKNDHIRINLDEDVRSKLTTEFEHYSFVHQALPEIDFQDVDTSCEFLGKKLKYPILFSSMTGGTVEGDRINETLAEAAQLSCVAMGVGSQRAAIENEDYSSSLRLRKIAPDISLYANIGAVQLNYGFGIDECRKAVEMIEADGLFLHLNPLQEVLQVNGQTNFSGLLNKIEKICSALAIPIIIKEVGWGISSFAARKLIEAGVSAIDVAGAGGTSWSEVEKHRIENEMLIRISTRFNNWGIPTARALKTLHEENPLLPLIASGGLKCGLELAKAISLGASLGGFAGAFLKAATVSVEDVLKVLDEIALELRITMFAIGARTISDLSNSPLDFEGN